MSDSMNTYLLRGILLLKSPGLIAADRPFLKNAEEKNLKHNNVSKTPCLNPHTGSLANTFIPTVFIFHCIVDFNM